MKGKFQKKKRQYFEKKVLALDYLNDVNLLQ